MTAVNYLWNPINDNIVREFDDAGNTIAEYTTEPDLYGNVVSQFFRNGQTSYLLSDAQGNTTEPTNDVGNVTDTIRYSAFGEVTQRTGTTEIPFQYVGQKGYCTDGLSVVAGLTLVVVFAIIVADAAGQAKGYVYEVRDKTGRAREIVFSGDAGWLVKQDDPKSHFHALPDLRRLTLVAHDISEEEMKYIASLSGVTELDVGSVTWGLPEDNVRISGKSLAHIGTMTWLEELEITASELKDADWSFLPGCKSLKQLSTGPDVKLTDRFFDYAAQVRTLESLDVRGTSNSCSDKALKRISELPKLKRLQISSPNLTDEGVKHLERLTELDTLSVFGNLSAQSIAYLQSQHQLRDLCLGIRRVPRSAMETIAQFKNLERLDLSRAEIGDEEVVALRDHPSLRELFLNSARVTDRSREVLESLDHLEHVSLRGTDESRRVEEAVNERIRRERSVKVED